MAKQKGIITLSGSLDGKTYYHSYGKDLVKKKSSLDKNRFYIDAAFEGSRTTASHIALTAPLASRVYRRLPKKLQKQGMIGKMIGEAARLFRAGLSEPEIAGMLYLKFNTGAREL